LVEALTGERPFTGKSYQDLLNHVLHGSFHLSGESPEVKDLDRIIQQCVVKDRALRFSSVSELQRDLIRALQRCRVLVKLESSILDADTISS